MFHSGFPPQHAFNPFDDTDNRVQSQHAFNPFDDMDNRVQTQDAHEFMAFEEIGNKGLTEFLDQEERECQDKHKFIEEEPMDEPHNSSVFSGISDKSIVLRNNGLWTGDTSGVNLEKLREETRLSRCEYFRHNSSRFKMNLLFLLSFV